MISLRFYRISIRMEMMDVVSREIKMEEEKITKEIREKERKGWD